MNLDKDFYTINEAAEVLGVHPITIYNQRNESRGIGPYFVKPSLGKLRITKENLQKALEGKL